MSFFSRIFRIGQAEAHSVIDKFEDPIKMTEQGIRDLKKDLQGAMTSLAEVKAIAIRTRRDADNKKKLAADYERKAMLLLQKAQGGTLDMSDAERLATEFWPSRHRMQGKLVSLDRAVAHIRDGLGALRRDAVALDGQVALLGEVKGRRLAVDHQQLAGAGVLRARVDLVRHSPPQARGRGRRQGSPDRARGRGPRIREDPRQAQGQDLDQPRDHRRPPGADAGQWRDQRDRS